MINLKQIPNSKDEIFNDFAKVYKRFNIIDFTIYQKYGEYSLKLCNQDFYNLLIEWQKVSVNKIDFHKEQYIQPTVDRSMSKETKKKLSVAQSNFFRKTTSKNILFTKEDAILQGVAYWNKYHTDFSRNEFIKYTNYSFAYFMKLFPTWTEFKSQLPCYNEIRKLRFKNASKAHKKENVSHIHKEKEYIPYEEKLQVKQSLEKQKYLKPLFESELKRIYAQFQNDDSCKKFTLQYFFKYADKQLTIYFLKKIYGTFAKFTTAYGIQPFQHEYTKESILKRCFELYHKYGKFNSAIQRSHIPESAVNRLFGSFNNLLREMNLPINCNKKLTKEEILSELSKLVKKYGILNKKIIEQECSISHPTILKYFGSLENVYNELNIINNNSSKVSKSGTFCILQISTIIQENPIFEKQFKWLKHKNYLSLDGYFHNHKLAIEYDGPFHDEQFNKNFRSKMHYQKSKFNDNLKDKLCSKHGIKLIRIPYTEELTIENLSKILKQHNII